jgi:hypothetical protein
MWCRASVVLGVVLCVVLGVVLGVSKVWCRRVPCRLHHTHYATLTAPHIPAPSHCTTLHYTLHHAHYTTVALHHTHSLPCLSQIPPSAEWSDVRWHASKHRFAIHTCAVRMLWWNPTLTSTATLP